MATVTETLTNWDREIKEYLEEINSFSKNEPPIDEIMKSLSGMSARAAYMRHVAAKHSSRAMKDSVKEEIDPFLKEVSQQFQIWSRIETVRKNEWDQSRF